MNVFIRAGISPAEWAESDGVGGTAEWIGEQFGI